MNYSLSELFKAAGDPVRLEILKMLAGKELCVCKIIDSFSVSQPTISHHLKVLKYAGLVSDRKVGKWVYYRLNNAKVSSMIEFLQAMDNGVPIVTGGVCNEEE